MPEFDADYNFLRKNIISSKQACELLGISRQRLFGLVKRGMLRPLIHEKAFALFLRKDVISLKHYTPFNNSSKSNNMEYKQKLKKDVSPTLYDKDKFLAGIEMLYEDNAKLVNENYNLKVQLTENELKIKTLETENKQLKAQLSPADYNSSFTQEFTTE